ncbi:hypothetical protein C8R43DRAFT_962516 [Mycena crocata]|nr:hypothetical protein C8R43DRAFT_962516 [Mycena crocata]
MTRAIHCGRAFGALALAHRFGNQLQEYGIRLHATHNIQSPELLNIVQILSGSPILLVDSKTPTALQWGLRIYPSLSRSSLDDFLNQLQPNSVPSLDSSSFADYLFAINYCLSCVNAEDENVPHPSWTDKGPFKSCLIAHLFVTLSSKLEHAILQATVLEIVSATAHLAGALDYQELYPSENHQQTWDRKNGIYIFCATFARSAGWVDVVSLATSLARVRPISEIEQAQHEDWVNGTIARIDDLLQALYFIGGYHEKPPMICVRVILQALFTPGDISLVSFLVLCEAKHWFQDPDLSLLMQDGCGVSAACITVKTSRLVDSVPHIGNHCPGDLISTTNDNGTGGMINHSSPPQPHWPDWAH